MKKRYILLLLVIGFGAIFLLLIRDAAAPTVQDTDRIAENSLAPESAPATKDDLITVEAPRPNAVVTSPLIIKGKARGNWYFEGSFPVTLLDAQGNVLVEHYATAQGEWMTTEYVPFTASLTYTAPAGTRGFLVLKKDNPSGESQFDNSLTIPVTL